MKKLDKSKVTPEFLIESDGKIVWIRDDYLSMRGIADDPDLIDFLDHVADMKEETRKTYNFKY